jgi:hypothetical protein
MDKMSRFDLEEKLMQNHNIVEDLKVLASYILENPDSVDRDFIFNALNGLACLQEARNDATWHTFLQTFELDGYHTYWKTYTKDEDYNEEENENRTSTK